MVGIGVATRTSAGNPKRHTPRRGAAPRARTNNTEREHTSKAQSSRQLHEAPNAHRSGGNKATHSTQQPEAQRNKLHETAPCHERKQHAGHRAHSHHAGAGQTPAPEKQRGTQPLPAPTPPQQYNTFNTVETMHSTTSSPWRKAPCAQMHRRHRKSHFVIGNATSSQEMRRWCRKRCSVITPCKDNTKHGAIRDHGGYWRPRQRALWSKRAPKAASQTAMHWCWRVTQQLNGFI